MEYLHNLTQPIIHRDLNRSVSVSNLKIHITWRLKATGTLCSLLQHQCVSSTPLEIISGVVYKPIQVTVAELWLSWKAAVTDSVFLHLFLFLNLCFPVLSFSLTPSVKGHLVTFPHHFLSVPLLCLFYCKYFPQSLSGCVPPFAGLVCYS